VKPTIGRIVHFTGTTDKETYPGIVVEVLDNGLVNLATFGKGSLYFNQGVPFSLHPQSGHWSWPPRES